MIYNYLYGGFMKKIEILDCTLRDGGYVNHWGFNDEEIIEITDALKKSNIEYIEAGFLTNQPTTRSNKTLYTSVSDVKNKIVMINYGEYDFNKIDKSTTVRIAFKKHHIKTLAETLKILNNNHITFSLNPMHISLYNSDELSQLFDIVNKYTPFCLTAVDTMGIMNESETKNLFVKIDKNIEKNIKIGFHSHNNLNLSLNNTKELLSLGLDRSIIIDSSLDGLGRGGGMLSTNDIATFLNNYYNKSYDIELLNAISEKHIKIINTYDKSPYSLTARNKCHPNYGRYLFNKNINNKEINSLLKKIPNEHKSNYNEKVIQDIYKKNFPLL